MGNYVEYKFEIDGVTPDKMSFKRLLAYYSELQKVFGVGDNLHLLEISTGSHRSLFAIDEVHEKAVHEQFGKLEKGTASKTATKAYCQITAMFDEDEVTGTLRAMNDNREVIRFSGPKEITDNLSISVTVNKEITGRLYYIAGALDNDENVKVRIESDSFGKIRCTTSRNIAEKLGNELFKYVRVDGKGEWTMHENGRWSVNNFVITDYTALRQESLQESVDQIRKMNIEWPADTLKIIDDIRGR